MTLKSLICWLVEDERVANVDRFTNPEFLAYNQALDDLIEKIKKLNN